MSKVEKSIQEARDWRKKHEGEAIDFTKLDGALALWEAKVKHLSETQAQVKAARTSLRGAKKGVSSSLKETKSSRKVKETPKV